MSIYKELIHKYITNHEKEIVSELKELIKIPSVRNETEENAPFGRVCAEVLKYAKKLYEKEGFETEFVQKDGYLLSCFGRGEKTIGLFAHADVVPVSDNWILTSPFEPIEKDGFLVGRGTLDDKSAVIASLYCMKMLKELNIPLKNRLMCFTGGNEESGMQDVKNYLLSHNKPDFSLVPDTAFPVFRGNKGRITFSLKSLEKLSEDIEISGGTGATVIGDAVARIPFRESLYAKISSLCNEKISAEHNDKFIIVKAKGIAKHSAIPEGSVSAVMLLAEILKECGEFQDNDRKIFENIYNISCSHYGEFFGIESSDKDFGKLTCVLTKITTKNGKINADFNIRYGAATNQKIIAEKITDTVDKNIWSVPEFGAYSVPHSLDEDNSFVKRLLGVYKEFTGCENPESYVNAGGTYRQYLKDAVEVGTTNIWGVPDGLPVGHGGAHQPDECISIEGFLEAIEITMLMILEIDKILEENE